MKKYISLAAILLAVGSPTIGQDTRPYELANSDSDLNQTYAKIMRRLGPIQQGQLRTAQRFWVQFRDAECRLAIADVRDCLMERTDQRTEQLKSTFYTDKAGNIFSLGN